MNGKAILMLIEKHVEKGVLAIAAVFTLLMAWMYMFGSPNKVKFGNDELGPRDLFAKARESASGLESAVRNAKAEQVKSVDSAKDLVNIHNQGIFAELAPAKPADPSAKPDATVAAKPVKLTPVPRVLTSGGGEIVVPGLKESEDASASIALITPQAPEQPAVRTGLSMATPKSAVLTASAKPAGREGEKAPELTQVGWASIAAYWDRDAHKSAMQQAGYAAYRSKVYVAGVEVEREELLASGEWSPAKIVEGSKAMPEFKIHEPAFDSNGTLINKQELEEDFNVVRSQQNQLLQPPFYAVASGDKWGPPPIAGHMEEEDEETPTVASTSGKKEHKEPKPTIRPPTNTGGGRTGGGGRFAGGGGDFAGGGDGGGRIGAGGAAAGDRAEKEAQKKQAKKDLSDAKEAYDNKEYSTAMSKAQAVENNDNATNADKKSAKELAAKAEKKMAEANAGGGGGRIMGGDVVGGGVMDEGGGGRVGGRMAEEFGGRSRAAMPAPTGSIVAQPLLMHPDRTAVPAVFYHDDTVEPGKTYRYRTRVNLWNRYVGQIKALKNPEDAKKAILHGEWSLWSDPVTITPTTRFFVRSLKPGTDKAVVEVWKWIAGKWIKRNFEPGVGEIIGGDAMVKPDELGDSAASEKGEKEAKPRSESFSTGAVVLDIRVDQPVKVRQSKGKGAFDYRDQKSLVLVYLDPADGQVKERVQVLDNSDPLRKKLAGEGGDGG